MGLVADLPRKGLPYRVIYGYTDVISWLFRRELRKRMSISLPLYPSTSVCPTPKPLSAALCCRIFLS